MSTFITHIEGTPSHICMEHPGRITENEAQGHVENYLLNGLQKNSCDSLRYLYDNPQVTYSQLIMATRRAELEIKEERLTDPIKSKATNVENIGWAGTKNVLQMEYMKKLENR